MYNISQINNHNLQLAYKSITSYHVILKYFIKRSE